MYVELIVSQVYEACMSLRPAVPYKGDGDKVVHTSVKAL
jgi:hypothetical protein